MRICLIMAAAALALALASCHKSSSSSSPAQAQPLAKLGSQTVDTLKWKRLWVLPLAKKRFSQAVQRATIFPLASHLAEAVAATANKLFFAGSRDQGALCRRV